MQTMPTYYDNYALAIKLATRIKRNITSTNDIIADADLPAPLRPNDIPAMKKEHGVVATESYMDFVMKLILAREVIQRLPIEKQFPQIITKQVAIGLLGLEGGIELSTSFICELTKVKRKDYVILKLKSLIGVSEPSAIVLFGIDNRKLQFNLPSTLRNISEPMSSNQDRIIEDSDIDSPNKSLYSMNASPLLFRHATEVTSETQYTLTPCYFS